MSDRYRNPEWLERKYHEEELTQREIAEECGVSPRTIRKYMAEHRIESREIAGKNHPLYGKERSEETKRKISESLEGRTFSEETLRRMSDSHIGNNLSEETRTKIANSLSGIIRSEGTRRKMSESTKGEANPMWKGGVWKKTWYGDSEWIRARNLIRERDRVCQRCGHDGSERLLDVHHIVPVRVFAEHESMSVIDAHCEGNLVLLCRTCHWEAETGEIQIIPDTGSIPEELSQDILQLWIQSQLEEESQIDG